MKWVVQVPVYGLNGIRKRKIHEFDTRQEAEDFRDKLGKYSEIYSSEKNWDEGVVR